MWDAFSMGSQDNQFRSPARVDGADLRERNLAVVLHDLLFAQPTSRSEIADRTGLAKASLTGLIPELEALGLAVEASTSKPAAGRPSKLLTFDGKQLAVVICEVSETEIITESLDLTGRILRVDREPHKAKLGDVETVVKVMANTIQQHRESIANNGSRPIHMVLVVGAAVRGEKPIVLQSKELGWNEPVDLVGLMEARIPQMRDSISLVSGVNVAAKAEFEALKRLRLGYPKSVVYLKPDTGISSAIILDGNLLVGAQGMSPILAHIEVDSNGEICDCGRRGCLVAQVGPRKVLELAGLGSQITESGLQGALQVFVDNLKNGDEAAVEASRKIRKQLNKFAETLALLYDPDFIVLGGYWAEIFEILELNSEDLTRRPNFFQTVEGYVEQDGRSVFRPAAFGARAARVGALQEVFIRVLNRPLMLKDNGMVPALGPIAEGPTYIW